MPFNLQAPQFDRWSGHSQGRMESVKSSQPPSGRGSRNLQFPILDENPLTPGYSEPRCVSRLCATSQSWVFKWSNRLNRTHQYLHRYKYGQSCEKKKPVFVLLELSNQMLSFTKLIIKQGVETKVLLLQRLRCWSSGLQQRKGKTEQSHFHSNDAYLRKL